VFAGGSGLGDPPLAAQRMARVSAARAWNEILWTLFPIAILAILAWRYGA